jgi:hypothetical protein
MQSRIVCILAFAWIGCGNKTIQVGADLSTPPPANDLSMGCAPGPDLGTTCVLSVSGKVVMTGGAPANNLLVSVCAGTCYFGRTGADGNFTTLVDAQIPYDQFALMLHGRPDNATYYTPLPPLAGMSSTFAAPLPLPAMPSSGPTIALDISAQTLTSGDVTLTLAAGTMVQLSVEDVVNGAPGKQFRALTIAQPSSMPFVDAAAPPDALYGFSPFESVFSQKAQLTFTAPAGFANGIAVDVQQMTVLIGGAPPAGRFVHAANAHVVAGQVVMDAGEGVTGLSFIALKMQ